MSEEKCSLPAVHILSDRRTARVGARLAVDEEQSPQDRMLPQEGVLSRWLDGSRQGRLRREEPQDGVTIAWRNKEHSAEQEGEEYSGDASAEKALLSWEARGR
jgi:hypothetical protein